MKHIFQHSFRSRLLISFLAVSLIPLLICATLLVQITHLRMNQQTRENLQTEVQNVSLSLDRLAAGLADSASLLQDTPVIRQALLGSKSEDTSVNSALFTGTEQIRDYGVAALYDLSGNLRYSTRNSPSNQSLPTNWGVLYSAGQNAGEPVYMACQDPSDSTQPLLQAAVVLKSPSGRSVGYLVLEIYQKDFQALFEGTYGTQSSLLLLNRYWHPIYTSQPSLLEDLVPPLRSQLFSGQSSTDSDKDYASSITVHPATGLYLVLRQPQLISQGTMRILYTVSIFSAIICIAAASIVCVKLSRQISSPIRDLQQAFSKLEEDDLNVQMDDSRQDELGQLVKGFNSMVSALKRNREDLVRNQRELNQTQIRMLQAQLNPHFLCNTLDTMKWISKINHVPQVAEISADLADILRFCISPEEFVPLARELAVLERYIDIQKIRLSDDFAYETSVQEGLYRCMIPKMILQPIVENAIIHGLQGVNNSVVKVEIAPAGTSHIRITVTDNGHGLPDDMIGKPYQKKRSPDGKHLGLYNVNLILTKHFGQDSALHLDVGPGGIGTAVTATLPVYMEENEHAESIDCGR